MYIFCILLNFAKFAISLSSKLSSNPRTTSSLRPKKLSGIIPVKRLFPVFSKTTESSRVRFKLGIYYWIWRISENSWRGPKIVQNVEIVICNATTEFAILTKSKKGKGTHRSNSIGNSSSDFAVLEFQVRQASRQFDEWIQWISPRGQFSVERSDPSVQVRKIFDFAWNISNHVVVGFRGMIAVFDRHDNE